MISIKAFPLGLLFFIIINLQIETLIHQFHFNKNHLKNTYHTHISSFKDHDWY